MIFEMPAKWAFPITAVWWAGFAQYTYKNLPEPESDMSKDTHILLKGFKELARAYQGVKELPYLKIFLLAFFIYSMGVQTVMQMATLFGIQEIQNMPESGLIISVLIIQFIAVAGSYGFSFLSGKMGNVKALAVSLIIWIVICIIAYFIYHPWEFYALAALVGLVMGGIQSLSRSTYSKMLPPTKDLASYFSFYDITEKIGVVIGTFSFGWIVGITGSMRNSVFALLLYFLIGLIIITRVKYNWKK
jgi:UMF1 family MFS transporter